ncbi:MAG: response regulator [Flavobacteriales bacterium]|nr:response regulator [Flavobacteriales bacterium]
MLNSVYIIDDDPISILVTETMMRKNDFVRNIMTFEEPKQALDHFESQYQWESGVPDYIFLDVQMPEINAWQFLERYAKINPSISGTAHIILLSATFNPDDESRARSHPMVIELITKPVNGTILDRLRLK